MMSAPDWLRVRSVTVESEEGRKVLSREDLMDYAFPLGPFTMTVEVAPTRRD